MSKIIVKVAKFIFLIGIVIVAIPYARLVFSPFAWNEADLNKDGFISFNEAGYLAEYGSRQISKSGKSCIEYYSQKDGLSLKTVCQ